MNKEFLVPVLRYVISGTIAAFAGWLLQTFGVEITVEQKEYLSGELTTQGAALLAGVAAIMSRWLKPWLLRRWHPGVKTVVVTNLRTGEPQRATITPSS